MPGIRASYAWAVLVYAGTVQCFRRGSLLDGVDGPGEGASGLATSYFTAVNDLMIPTTAWTSRRGMFSVQMGGIVLSTRVLLTYLVGFEASRETYPPNISKSEGGSP